MKKVTVLGGGVSGKAAALLARKSGDEPLILNDGGDVSLPSNSQLIVASPGVHPLRSALYKAAAASGIEFIGEMEYAFRNFKTKPVKFMAFSVIENHVFACGSCITEAVSDVETETLAVYDSVA